MPLQAVFTGTHSPSPVTSTACRTMEVESCVWDADVKSVSFSVLAVFPTIPRWESTRLPRRSSLVTVMGDIVGTASNNSSQAVVVIRSFSYIFVRSSEKSTNKSMNERQVLQVMIGGRAGKVRHRLGNEKWKMANAP